MNKSRINSVIFYYSQIVTENTKRVAENIAIGLRRNNNKCSSFGHPTTEELGEARKFGEKLIDKMNFSKRLAEKKFWARDNPSAKMWSWEGIQEWFPKFHLNKQKCTKCGICAKICPWDAIKLTPYPEWIKKCDRCYICELKCPENAIECDFTDQIEYLENLMRSKKKG